MFCLCVLYTTCMSSVCMGQKRPLDPLGLKLHVVLSHHVGAGNRNRVLCQGGKCSFLLSHFSILILL